MGIIRRIAGDLDGNNNRNDRNGYETAAQMPMVAGNAAFIYAPSSESGCPHRRKRACCHCRRAREAQSSMIVQPQYIQQPQLQYAPQPLGYSPQQVGYPSLPQGGYGPQPPAAYSPQTQVSLVGGGRRRPGIIGGLLGGGKQSNQSNQNSRPSHGGHSEALGAGAIGLIVGAVAGAVGESKYKDRKQKKSDLAHAHASENRDGDASSISSYSSQESLHEHARQANHEHEPERRKELTQFEPPTGPPPGYTAGMVPYQSYPHDEKLAPIREV